MNKERILLWAVVILILGGTIFALVKLPKKDNTSNNGTPGQTVEIPSVSEIDWLKGNKESKITLLEYGDFQCPACAAYHPLVDKLLKEQGGNFRFIYRHFPLRQHANAKPAAYAAESAGKQGKFWEMYDLLFKGQNNWSEHKKAKDIFVDYARSLGLNMEQFEKDFNSSEVKSRVEADLQSALKIGINSTPTFYLNNKKIQPSNYEQFTKLIGEASSTGPEQVNPSATP